MAAAEAAGAFSDIDILINNAGVAATGGALDVEVVDCRFGELQDLDGPLLLLLASAAGAYMTGTSNTVDGGHLVSSL